MSDCLYEARNLRLRQLELALTGDSRCFDIAEIMELKAHLEARYSDTVNTTQLGALKERYRYTLNKNNSGVISCRIFSVGSSAGSSKNSPEIQRLLHNDHWPFALCTSKISDRDIRVIKLKQNKVLNINFIANELDRLIKKEWTPTLRCDSSCVQLLSAMGGNEEMDGLIFREQDKNGMSHSNAVFIACRIVGSTLKLPFYNLFLPDQFALVPLPTESAAMQNNTSLGLKNSLTPEESFISHLLDSAKPEVLLPSAAAIFEDQFIATVAEQLKKLVGEEIQAL